MAVRELGLMMVGGVAVLEGARALAQFAGIDITFLGISLINWIIIIAVIVVALATVLLSARRQKRKKLVSRLRKQQMAMERARKDLFAERKADDIHEAVLQPGKPKTIIPDGSVAYTETGEMLVFGSSPATDKDDAVASVLGSAEAKAAAMAPPTWSPSYRIELVIALHITGVAMFAVDPSGKVTDGRDLEPELLIVLEQLLEEARWLGGKMVTGVYRDRTASLTWGESIHMAAVVDGEPDERLDRELRWAIGDLVDEFSDEIWAWGEDSDASVSRLLTKRIARVFNLTASIAPGALAAMSQGGGLRVTSTVSWRHSLAEYSLGILNRGPGPVQDIELLPYLSREGLVDVVTVHGIEIDQDNKFRIDSISQGRKAVATFLFRALDPMDVRVDCTLVYRRGVTNIQQLRLPGRWIELEQVELIKGEPVEPERVLELATQPSTFRDRCALFIPRGFDTMKLFNAAIEGLKEHFEPVVELEDDVDSQLEAWFHAELRGRGTVVASVTLVPSSGIVDIFAASTVAGVVPGTMVLLRKQLNRAARQHLPDVIDPELRSTVPRKGVLLFQSWGFFEE